MLLGIVAVALFVWLMVAREMRHWPGALLLWAGGAGLWGVAILLDEGRWESFGQVASKAVAGLEEVAEQLGSVLMVVSLLAVLLLAERGAGGADERDRDRFPSAS